MAEPFAKGDRVSWTQNGQTYHGRIERKLTRPYQIKGFTAQASKDEPMWLCITDAGNEAAHSPEELRKLQD